MEYLALKADLREQLGERRVHRVLCGSIVEQRGHHHWVVVRREHRRILLGPGRQSQRLRLHQIARGQVANDLLIRPACRLKIALRDLPLGCRLRQCRLRLCHVSPGDLADAEPVIGRLQLLRQHLLIIDVQREQLLRLDDANIGVHHIAKAGLLLRDQVRALGDDLVLRAIDAGLRLAAVIDGLAQRRLRGADEPVGLRVEKDAGRLPNKSGLNPSP